MTSTIRLGRIGGVDVGVNWSVLFVAWLLAWSLADQTLPDEVPSRSSGAYWAVGIITAVVFLASILAHELGHAAAARRNGVEVEDITIWMFGGVSRLKGSARSARGEFMIAIAGPLVSAAVAAVALIAAAVTDQLGADDLVTAALLWLGAVNGVLVVFNLLPAAPLDGGRVLSSMLWRRWGDELRAHRAASSVGHWFGILLVLIGVVFLAGGDIVGGAWFAFLGWFLASAADAERNAIEARFALAGVKVSDVMTRDPEVAPASLPVDRFVDEFVARSHHGAYPIADAAGHVVGLLTLRRLRRASAAETHGRTVADLATPVDKLVTTTPQTPIVDVLTSMNESGDGRVLVFETDGHDRLVGIVSPTDVSRLMEVVALRRSGSGRPPVLHE